MSKHFYLYIDDSGTRFPDKQQPARDDGMDYFALGGILIEDREKGTLKEKYLELCTVWDIPYPLHSTAIRGMRDDFAWLEESSKQRDNFLGDLDNLLVSVPVLGFAAVIHRPGYNTRYEGVYGSKRWWMCRTTYSILIERVAKYVIAQGGTFEIRFEGAGKVEDRALLQYAKDLKTIGSPFSAETSQKYHALTAEEYRSVIVGEPRRKKKSNLFVQIADLYLYPMVKRKYDESYRPWQLLYSQGKVIDACLVETEHSEKGIKYSCFDDTEKQKTQDKLEFDAGSLREPRGNAHRQTIPPDPNTSNPAVDSSE